MRIEITAHVRDGLYPRSRQPSSLKEGFFMPYAQAQQTKLQADFRVTYHGMVTTITPLSDRCREWLEDKVAIEPWQRFGPSIAIEPRYVEQLAAAMADEGLVMEADNVAEKERSTSRRGRRGNRSLFVIAIALVLALAGCGPDRRAAYQGQLEADHQACLNGTTPNACVAYQLDVQKCSPITGNPIAAGCY
jgi:hypothetical protein